MIKRWIWVTFQKAGFHKYVLASTEERLGDVSYLANKHRHLFKFKVKIEVFHYDRDLEFHQVLNYCESLYTGSLDVDYKSVEMIAEELHGLLKKKYPHRDMEIEVSEDGECGAIIEFKK